MRDTDLLGAWKAKNDIACRTGNSVFTLPRRSIINVVQFDKDKRKVLIEFGPSVIEWKHKRFLERFERLD